MAMAANPGDDVPAVDPDLFGSVPVLARIRGSADRGHGYAVLAVSFALAGISFRQSARQASQRPADCGLGRDAACLSCHAATVSHGERRTADQVRA